jgi:hypothetical protein
MGTAKTPRDLIILARLDSFRRLDGTIEALALRVLVALAQTSHLNVS